MIPNRYLSLALVSGLLCFGRTSLAEEPGDNRRPLAIWEPMAEITTGVGFRNNVLRSSIDNENSGFFLTAGDASLMRYSETGSLLLLYIFFEDTRYTDAPSVNYEQFLSGAAQFSTPVGERNEVGLEVNYLYQHQIIDASTTEVNVRRLLVLGHSATVRPHLKHTSGAWETRLEAAAFRQIYEQELDNYWDVAARASLTRNYGSRSEASIGYLPLLRLYDTREQYDEAGLAVPGTELTYFQNEVGGEWRHNWDLERNWRTISKLSYMLSQDNGSGYFDYSRIQFRQQVRWSQGKWNVKATARLGWYDYKTQRINNERRERSYAWLGCRIERRFGEHWFLYTSGDHEWSMSNDPRDEYRSWMANFGVGYEF